MMARERSFRRYVLEHFEANDTAPIPVCTDWPDQKSEVLWTALAWAHVRVIPQRAPRGWDWCFGVLSHPFVAVRHRNDE
jgi:hypothetical protein